MELNKIYNEDCLTWIKKVENESVDLVITDPPYGDGIGYGRNNKEIANNEDESINYKILPDLYRVLKRGGVCYLFTNWKFTNKLQQFIEKETNFTIRMQLVIVKNNIGMGYGFRNQYELCLVLEKDKATYNRADFSNVLHMEHIQHDTDTHPHQKGIGLIKLLLDHNSKEGDLVLDCFGGSGSTFVACKEMKRNFLGCEISEEYCKIAKERLDNTNQSMF